LSFMYKINNNLDSKFVGSISHLLFMINMIINSSVYIATI